MEAVYNHVFYTFKEWPITCWTPLVSLAKALHARTDGFYPTSIVFSYAVISLMCYCSVVFCQPRSAYNWIANRYPFARKCMQNRMPLYAIFVPGMLNAVFICCFCCFHPTMVSWPFVLDWIIYLCFEWFFGFVVVYFESGYKTDNITLMVQSIATVFVFILFIRLLRLILSYCTHLF
jgi:hypothetical protein